MWPRGSRQSQAFAARGTGPLGWAASLHFVRLVVLDPQCDTCRPRPGWKVPPKDVMCWTNCTTLIRRRCSYIYTPCSAYLKTMHRKSDLLNIFCATVQYLFAQKKKLYILYIIFLQSIYFIYYFSTNQINPLLYSWKNQRFKYCELYIRIIKHAVSRSRSADVPRGWWYCFLLLNHHHVKTSWNPKCMFELSLHYVDHRPKAENSKSSKHTAVFINYSLIYRRP